MTNPNSLPDVQEGFGDDSECWKDPEKAALCVQACQTGLEQTHELFPDEPRCDPCQSDSECDQEAGERCLEGECKIGDCGDGLVQSNELCDGQTGCTEDCLDGAECSPLTGVGCTGSFICGFYEDEFTGARIAGCLYPDDGGLDPVNEVGGGCGFNADMTAYADCGVGLECVPEALADFNCSTDACCTPLCDLNAPSCPMGLGCVSYGAVFGVEMELVLLYIGVCVP